MAKSIWLCTVLALSAVQNSLGGSLYDEDDDVLDLRESNFTELVLESDKLWMVEFYSEWCGHCRNFAPTFKEVAQLAKPWSRYISVGAVNCVDEKTVCLDHKVTRYPTIRYFTHPSPQNSSTTLELEHAGGRSAQHLHGEIAAVLFSRWHEVPVGERLHPGFAEVFEEDARNEQAGMDDAGEADKDEKPDVKKTGKKKEAYDAISVKDSPRIGVPVYDERYEIDWRSDSPTASLKDLTHMLVVFEDSTQLEYLGSQLAVDYLDTPTVKVFMGPKFLVPTFGIKNLPAVVVMDRSSPANQKLDERTLRDSVLASVPVNVGATNENIKPAALKPKTGTPGSRIAQLQNSGKEVVQGPNVEYSTTVHSTDLRAVVGRIFFLEIVAMRRTLTPNDIGVLSDFAMTVAEGFPLLDMRKQLKTLAGDLRKKSKKELTADQYLQLVTEHLDADLRNLGDTWNTCRGSHTKYRGYTCGLWILFHSLTVNCAYSSTQYVAGVAPEGRTVCGGDQIFIFKDFLLSFFGCEECATHFAAAVDKYGNEIRKYDQKQAAMWMWRIHNVVNKRLQKEAGTDPSVPKIEFPPLKLCEQCVAEGASRGNDFDTKWSDADVYTFLQHFYSPVGIAMDSPPVVSGGVTVDPLILAGLLLIVLVLYRISGIKLKSLYRKSSELKQMIGVNSKQRGLID